MKSALPLAIAAALVVAVSCSKSTPPPPPDGGTRQDAGQDAGSDAGTDAGSDAGSDAGDSGTPDAGPWSCTVPAQDCDAGSCLFADGGPGTACFVGACDLVGQDCASGEKCSYQSDGGVTYRACLTEGTANEGEACPTAQSPNGCVKGLICVAPGDGGSGVCERFCYADSDCPSPETCEGVLTFAGTPESPSLCVTLQECDLLQQNCPDGQGCYLDLHHDGGACLEEGSSPVGGPCSRSNDCVKGAACDGTGTCRQLCGTSGTQACQSGTCEPASAPAPSGVGLCL